MRMPISIEAICHEAFLGKVSREHKASGGCSIHESSNKDFDKLVVTKTVIKRRKRRQRAKQPGNAEMLYVNKRVATKGVKMRWKFQP